TMAKLLPFVVVFFLVYTSSAYARLESPAKDVKKDVINRVTVVNKGGLPGIPTDKQPPNNILLPTDAELDESDDSIHVGIDFDEAEETVPSVFEDKEPDFNAGDDEPLEEQIVSSKLEDKEPESGEKEPRGFRSTRPLTVVNLRPIRRFNPINRRFDHNGMRQAVSSFRLPQRSRRHHNIRRQIPVHQPFGPRFRPQREIEHDRDNTIALKKDVFLPRRVIPARWIDQSSLFREVNTEFPKADHTRRDEGMMTGEFKQPSSILHRRHHHHHHHDHEGEKVEVEEKEAKRGREREEREDDGVLKKVRKFLTYF
ncbi:hypothetical protein Ancab_015454, partial [Ancistrocladus abbreviatus]